MSTAEQPADGAPATGIQPAADADRIALPPPPAAKAAAPPVDPAVLRRRARGLDAVLVGVLLLFAFFAASYRAATSDLFMHLATGRLIVQGAYSFGEDPFTFGSAGRWVNHSWLFDVLAYGLYRLPSVGPEALVVAKALLVAGLAWLIFRAGSLPGRPAWISAASALLAVLTLSPRAHVQPVVLSYFFLGLTLYLLYTTPPGSRRLWALPAVCAVWVNSDGWFFLGPVTIGLHLLGEVLDPMLSPPKPGEPAPDRAHVRTLGLVALASLAACLLNPYHVFAFTPPALLSQTGSPLASEPQLRAFFVSPFTDYKLYLREDFGLSVAGMAYPVLLLGSLASFGLLGAYAADRIRLGRALVWLAMALLSAYNMRLIPFFAVVAGPIMALNYLDLAERLFGAEPRTERGWRRWAVFGRVLTILAGVGLILGSVGGYVQAQPYHLRKVGWGVEVDEGLKGAALQIAEWRGQEALPQGRAWFNLSPEVVNYFAWFCPGEKGFLDQRMGLFREAAADFVAVRKSLDGEELPREVMTGQAPPPWREVLARRGASFLVLHLYDTPRQNIMLQRLYSSPEEFVPCYVKGRTAIFAWRDPSPGAAPPPLDRRLPCDFAREAFGKSAEPVPAWVAVPPPEPKWWQPLLEPPGGLSPSGWEAWQHYTRFDSQARFYQGRAQADWVSFMYAGLVGQAAQPLGPVLPGTLVTARMWRVYGQAYDWPLLRFDRKTGKPEGGDVFAVFDERAFRMLGNYGMAQDAGPVESLYLAARLARRGLAESRHDARTSLVLAQVYSRLNTRTRERTRVGRTFVDEKGTPRYEAFFPHVERIRQAQIAAALNRTFKLNPPASLQQVAHMLLLEVYRAPQFLELQVKHFREYIKLCKALKHVPTTTPERAQEEMDQLTGVLKQLEQALKTNQDKYVVEAAGKPVLQRARAAVQFGLPETALKLLTEAKTDDLMAQDSGGVAEGLVMAVDLMLAVGRVDEAREVLIPEGREQEVNRPIFGRNDLGLPGYEWFRVVLGAATGDYASADRYLEECAKQTEHVAGASQALAFMELIATPWPREQERQGRLSLGEFAGVMVGSVLLREAPAAAHGWQWGRFAPLRPRIAQMKEVPFRHWLPGLEAGSQVLSGLLRQRADLTALRAWLALEQGETEKARELARHSVKISERNREGDLLYFDPAPSQPLAALVVDLTERLGRRTEDQAKKK